MDKITPEEAFDIALNTLKTHKERLKKYLEEEAKRNELESAKRTVKRGFVISLYWTTGDEEVKNATKLETELHAIMKKIIQQYKVSYGIEEILECPNCRRYEYI